MAEPTPGAPATVTDHRVAPPGVLPRRAQTWLMVAVALGILAIIVFTGHTDPTPRAVATMTTPVVPPSADRVREYQDRLRALDERAHAPAVSEPPLASPGPVMTNEGAISAPPDPLLVERKRRAYESLFASNLVLSRRPDAAHLAPSANDPRAPLAFSNDGVPVPPTIDEVADAVVRATSRYRPPASPPSTPSDVPVPTQADLAAAPSPATTGPRDPNRPVFRLLQGTVIDAVLTNRLDGSVAAPVNCLVTNPVYAHDGRQVLIPAGARVLGETKPVQTFGDTRLAVAFSRLVLPDGRTYALNQFLALNDIGDAGLRDQVNQHYRSTFGASAAVGLLSGFAQLLPGGGVTRGDGDRTIVIAGGVGDATAQATAQTMNRFLNRVPTITIREGHRVKVYVTTDIELPGYPVADALEQTIPAGDQ